MNDLETNLLAAARTRKLEALYEAARAFVHFSFAEEEDLAIAERGAVSSVPFVRVERRLREAVRALEEP